MKTLPFSKFFGTASQAARLSGKNQMHEVLQCFGRVPVPTPRSVGRLLTSNIDS